MRFIIAIVLIVLFEIYAFQLIRTLSRGHWWKWVYLFISVAIFANMVIQFMIHADRSLISFARDFSVTLFLALLVAKVVFTLVMFSEDIYRGIEAIVHSLSRKRDSETAFIASRRSFIAKIGLGLAALPFGAILYGAWKGKYNYQVRKYELSFKDLPEAFDGYQITQISDVHVGSFDNREEVTYAVNLVNQQKSDVIFFTGDLVNNMASEMNGWEKLFGTLTAPDGVFSVLGNHDYGDYVQWESKEAKQQNLNNLKNLQNDMGWKLLMDEHHIVTKKEENLAIVGVQNWGGGRFPKYGDLAKASIGLKPEQFKILLSHDPTHWDLQVKESDMNYHLTLSGHTHGMQFGIEIPGFVKLSPAWFAYKKWAGIYKEYDKFLNVNRGFGFLGYSGRAGIWPEITVIKLKRA